MTPSTPTAETDLASSPPRAGKSRGVSLAVWTLVTALLYFGLALAATWLSRQPGSIATVWYANAAAVSALQARPTAEWPILLCAVAIANAAISVASGDPTSLTLSFVLANVAEILLSSILLRRYWEPARSFTHVGALMRTLLLGGVGPTLAGALLGAALLSSHGLGTFPTLWFSWFEGSAIGSVSVLPFGLLLAAQGWRPVVRVMGKPEVVAALLAAVAVALYAPTTLPYPYVYVSVALVLVAVMGRFPAAAVGVLLCSMVVGTLTATGIFQPPPLTGSLSEGFFYLPLLMALMPPLLLAATMERIQQDVRDLAAKEAHFRTLYQRTPVMMHSIDTSGMIVNVSETWLARLGYQAHEVLGRPSIEFLTPESRQRAIDVVIPQFVRDGVVRNVDYQMVAKSGEIVDIELSAIWETDDDGRPLRSLAVLKDVTEQKRLAAELAADHARIREQLIADLEAEQERIQVTLHCIGDAVATTDEHGRITYLNPVAEDLVGWTLAEAAGQPFSDVVHLFDQASGTPLSSPVDLCLQRRQTYGLPESAVLRSRNGKEFGVQDTVAPILGRHGKVLGAVMVFQDVTEARALAQRMSYLAHHDALTDLPNRVLLQDRVFQACQFGQRHGSRFAVLFMDLDHFKHVNDSLGHAAGDELLKTIAARLAATLRGSDTVCRLGGDEFVMLLDELASPEDAADVAGKILREVGRPCVINGTEVNISVSLGIALFPDDGQDPDTLMKHADAAMYRCKREGRNRFHFFSKAVDTAATARLVLESDMRRGLSRHQFVAHYQPVVNARDRRVRAVEALARWAHPVNGMQSPATFIPVAEESGLIVPLGAQILQQACEQLAGWAGTPLGHLAIAVNVSPIQLAHPGFAQTLAELLRTTGANGTQLEIEITESTLMADPDAMLEVLEQVKALGVSIAIDDFGTGYSSLSYLRRFPVDTVKIDRSFVRDLETDPGDRELVRAILAMSRSLHLRVVAEGVETEAQASILAEMGCPALQGYLFARPADAATTTAWLEAGAARQASGDQRQPALLRP